MGFMLDGEWRTDIDNLADLRRTDDGEFVRDETAFRDWIGEDYPAEPGRYHLYVSYACPWAHRTLLVRSLLGLEDAVSVDVVDPLRFDGGWRFSPEEDGCTPDTVNGADHLREVYLAADAGFTGRVTVPVLWDREAGTIVNNESEEIGKMFATAMRAFGSRDIDLYPEGEREAIDAVIGDVYRRINNGVYRAGFAGSQSAYDEAVADVFAGLDEYDALLADRRYLVGDRLSLADVYLFPTLYRFDEVYHIHFKCNRRRIEEYDALWGYLRELYQLPGVAETCAMDHVKAHYYETHLDLNPAGIVPTGPDPDFGAPHDRDRLPGGPPGALVSAD